VVPVLRVKGAPVGCMVEGRPGPGNLPNGGAT